MIRCSKRLAKEEGSFKGSKENLQKQPKQKIDSRDFFRSFFSGGGCFRNGCPF